MIKTLFLSLLFSLLLCAKPLIFGIPPVQNPSIMSKTFTPVVEQLGKASGLSVELMVARKDYQQFIQQFVDGEIQVGFFPAKTYVETKELLPDARYLATALRRDSSGELKDYYRGVICVSSDSSIHSLKELQGKRFGFTNPHSSSGYLYPLLLLKSQGIEPDQMFQAVHMLQKHNKVIEAVMGKQIDAGATYEGMVVETNAKLNNSLRIIAQTPEIPFDAVVARPDVPDEMVKKLTEALRDYRLSEAEWSQVNISKSRPYGFVIRDDSFYDVVRQAKKLKQQLSATQE